MWGHRPAHILSMPRQAQPRNEAVHTLFASGTLPRQHEVDHARLRANPLGASTALRIMS